MQSVVDVDWDLDDQMEVDDEWSGSQAAMAWGQADEYDSLSKDDQDQPEDGWEQSEDIEENENYPFKETARPMTELRWMELECGLQEIDSKLDDCMLILNN